MRVTIAAMAGLGALIAGAPALAFDPGGPTYQVFQFPADKMPRIDGDATDWAMVPAAYVVGTDRMTEQDGKDPRPNPKTLDIRVKVGWVKGLNRLYFLYEAYDDYWDFALPGLHNDTFEVVVDADASGGPLIDDGHRDVWTADVVGAPRAAGRDPRVSVEQSHWANHGVHAQNYHIFTPARDKDWTMAWGSPTWIKNFPYANSVTRHTVEPGKPGRVTVEFWITAYDYAGPEGPQRAVESVLAENKVIGLGWVVIDYDDVASSKKGFWTLSSKRMMFGNASDLPAFRLMPLDAQFARPITADWSFGVVDMDRRLVAFRDLSTGATAWTWDFGDGTTSTERHPQHAYAKPGNFVVVLDVTGPGGKARRSKVWDVQLR